MKVAPIPYDRPATRAAEAAVAKRFTSILADVGKRAAAALRTQKLAKADDDDADAILNQIDLSDLSRQGASLGGDIAPVVQDIVQRTVIQVGLGDVDGFTGMVNRQAVAMAKARAAEMVTGITADTRAMLRQTIEDGLSDNIGMPAIADRVEASYAFSPERAALIAATEVSRANSEASLASYQSVAAHGVAVKKTWLAEPGCCDVCQANEDAGAIALDDPFPSSDQCPPNHPRCRCSLSPIIDDPQDDDAPDDDMTDDAQDQLAAYFRGMDVSKGVASESLMAPFHREAEHYKALRADLAKFEKAMEAQADVLAKVNADPDIFKSARAETSRAIERLDAYLAQPMPLPHDVLLYAMRVQGNA